MKEGWLLRNTSKRGYILASYKYQPSIIKYYTENFPLRDFNPLTCSSKILNLINKTDCDFAQFLKDYKPTIKQKRIILK